MDQTWLQYHLTTDAATDFERDGYVVLPGALTPDHVAQLSAAVERCRDRLAASHGVARCDLFNLLDFIGLDDAFFELIDHPTTFPKVWRILGWNLQIYHSHMIVAPPLSAPGAGERRHNLQSHRPELTRTDEIASLDDWWGWHRDSGQINGDLGGGPQARLSVKIA